MKLLFWVFSAVLAVMSALFAASNREVVAIGLWPFGLAELPLYVAVLGALLIGFIAGAAAAWVGGRHSRREARRRRRRITVLERELAETQARLPEAEERPVAPLPVRT